MCGGVCGIVIGGTEYELGENDAALIFADNVHGLVIKEAPFEFLTAQFIPRVRGDAEFDEMLFSLCGKCRNAGGAVYRIDGAVYPAVISCMRRICDERADTDISMYFTYLKSVLYELCRNASEKKGVPSGHTGKKSGGARLLNAVTDYIGENLSMISDLSFIGAVFHYSNSHVNRLFRSTLGVSVWQYITAKRLDLAHNLIADGQSAKSAALRCGFSDYSVFYRSYVKYFGAPPSALKAETARRNGPGAE
jgi:AraC-like DNA-binding protein